MAKRCRRIPPHRGPGGNAMWHQGGQPECDKMTDAEQGVKPPTVPGQTPSTTPEAPKAPAPAPPKMDRAPPGKTETPTVAKRLFAFADKSTGPAPGSPAAGQMPVVVNPEWEMSEEMCGRFWDAVLGIVRLAVRMIDKDIEVQHPLITERSNPLEIYAADRKLLADSTRKVLTKGMKDIGVKSLEEADELIANMGGGQVLVVIFGTIGLHYWQEVPDSGWYKRWQARVNANSAEIRANMGTGMAAAPGLATA